MKTRILGEDVEIRFCMAVEIAYEEIAGEPFKLDALVSAKNTVALDMAAIMVANPDTEITVERLTKEATGQEIAALNKAVVESLTEWLKIPSVIAEPQEEGEESPKN